MLQQHLPADDGYWWDDLDERYEDIGFVGTGLDVRDDPVPWYRTKQAIFAMTAIGVAIIAIQVSTVLLFSRDSGGAGQVEPANAGPTPTRSAQPSPTPTTASPRATVEPAPQPPPAPPSPPPAAPEAPAAGPVAPPPDAGAERPQIGVTRTPVTRSPMSVHPTRPPAFPNS